MPLIRDYTSSEKIDKLSAQAEVLFVRLLLKADLMGNFYSNAELIKSLCFPLKTTVRTADILRWLKELSTPASTEPGKNTSSKSTALIRMYSVEGKSYLHIYGYGQKLKFGKPKFPLPPEDEVEEEFEEEVKENTAPAFSEISTEVKPYTQTKQATETDLTEAQIWHEQVCLSQKITVEQCKQKLKEFITLQKAKENFQGRTINDLKKHFVDWLRIEMSKANKFTNNPPGAMKATTDKGFIDVWSDKFYSSLSENKKPEYIKHLESKGWKQVKSKLLHGELMYMTKAA